MYVCVYNTCVVGNCEKLIKEKERKKKIGRAEYGSSVPRLPPNHFLPHVAEFGDKMALRMYLELSILLNIFLMRHVSVSANVHEFTLWDIAKRVDESCVLVIFSPASNELSDVLKSLLKAFASEPRVSLGFLRESETYSELLRWKGGQKTALVAEDLAFYPRKVSDRTCLIRPEQTLKAERYQGARTFEALLEFLNSRCGTFRELDGALSHVGRERKRIVENLYSVPNNSNSARGEGPINLGSSCERIPMPTKEEFFHEYLFRSKPVIITGNPHAGIGVICPMI